MMRKLQKNTDPTLNQTGRRPRIAFFDYPDVFEDFYTHYGVSQEAFAKSWHNTANHARMKIVQEEIGDVTWYVLSLKPTFKEDVRHNYVACKVKIPKQSLLVLELKEPISLVPPTVVLHHPIKFCYQLFHY